MEIRAIWNKKSKRSRSPHEGPAKIRESSCHLEGKKTGSALRSRMEALEKPFVAKKRERGKALARARKGLVHCHEKEKSSVHKNTQRKRLHRLSWRQRKRGRRILFKRKTSFPLSDLVKEESQLFQLSRK